MKLVKGKINLPKNLRDILDVVYGITVLGVGAFLLFISWAYISGNTEAGNLYVMDKNSFPVSLDISDIGKLMINNSFYEASITKCEGMLLVKNPPLGLVLFTIIKILLGSAIFLYVINLLRKILMNISYGKQFNNENGIYIRNIGLIVIIGSIVKVAFEIILSVYLSANTTFENLKIIFNINLSSLLSIVFLGFVILVISQIFNHGTEIKKEQDLTI